MGIKGIYKEIGTGKRISLTKLAVEKLEETGRPLRIAIDIAIWQFQVQAGRGGSNPAVRTLFYRLLRLLGLSIQPIFVFDGPRKPVFKRNKRSGRGDGVATAMAKRMIRLFGFQVHDAPGEAEAECALLQQTGIVDAVLSEDVDTIMFGCTRTLRNWSSEGTKGSKTPTHVSIYDTQGLLESGAGLDREGMVLVALMSGGDYLPEGIPGAGVKVACEAARAGFGKALCRLKKSDTSEISSWKEWLAYELRHNESGFFKTRHKALSIPEDFPNIDVLRYYTHPVVSPASTLERLKQQQWDQPVDVQGLREFVRETFDWNYRIGAIKFIRVLAPCLLVRKLITRSVGGDRESDSTEVLEKQESELVRSITSRRTHFSTDSTPELRISFVPTKIVGYDFQEEPDEVIDYGRDGLALNSDEEFEPTAEDEGVEAVGKTSKKPFNPVEPDLFWLPETIAKLGIPITVEDWEEAQRAKLAPRQKAKAPKQKSKPICTTSRALDKFVKVTKNIPRNIEASKNSTPVSSTTSRISSPLGIPSIPSQISPPFIPTSQTSQKTRPARSSKQTKSKSTARNASPTSRPDASANPWTISSSHANARAPKAKSTKASETIIISSSPPTSPGPIHHSITQGLDNSTTENISSMSLSSTSSLCPRKRCFITPTKTDQRSDGASNSHLAVGSALSPSPKSSQKIPHRKLARTESLPVAQSPLTENKNGTQGEEDEFDLPPLSTVINKLPLGNKSSTGPDRPEKQVVRVPESKETKQQLGKDKKKQTTLNTFNTTKRMTKVYAPRKSEPGFFREVEVAADEADDWLSKVEGSDAVRGSTGRGATAAAWRRSDISCIDLTGED
ncbi:Flap endonuclease GEN like protein 1 [Daldinia childiae]|uniref:Flap endonuclease GEN like protein 1 n=1 Tax=Daldinia childiae TaxID=326645 RepID=UPI001446CB58|nr:Flap endonuclease GEN like protein 1 [Daldinia childiae]KAF3067296.1 Flap endonuclease GEN like protein 1 [Daldinia childiae]